MPAESTSRLQSIRPTSAAVLNWSTMSRPTLSLHAAKSWLVTGPGTSSPIWRLSTRPTGRMQKGVLVKKASSAV